MPFQLDEYLRLRPFAYHVTNRHNLALLRASRHLHTAATVIRDAGAQHLAAMRRDREHVLTTASGRIVLKDQSPLIAANIELAAGWSLGDFVEYLNSFTYFWPGTDRGPIGPGQRLLDHYEADGPAVLRCRTQDLLEANRGLAPEFCPFNSGAPRYHTGRRAYRGPNLFQPSDSFPRRASEVVELGFRGDVTLPASTLVRTPRGWDGLYEPAS